MKGKRAAVRPSIKLLLLAVLLIASAPFGVRLAQKQRASIHRTEAESAALSRAAGSEMTLTGDELNTTLPLRMIPLASDVLFWKEYFEVEE